jgi:hypothetical protein
VAFRVRLTAAERTLLDEKAASGVNLSQLIRSAVLGYRLPSPPIVREAMSELHRVGVNLNQLTASPTRPAIWPPSPSCGAIWGVLDRALRLDYHPARFAEGMVSIWTQRSSFHSSNPSAPVFALMRRAITMASASLSQATPCISNTLKVGSK